jgi:hypothetical protein
MLYHSDCRLLEDNFRNQARGQAHKFATKARIPNTVAYVPILYLSDMDEVAIAKYATSEGDGCRQLLGDCAQAYCSTLTFIDGLNFKSKPSYQTPFSMPGMIRDEPGFQLETLLDWETDSPSPPLCASPAIGSRATFFPPARRNPEGKTCPTRRGPGSSTSLSRRWGLSLFVQRKTPFFLIVPPAL